MNRKNIYNLTNPQKSIWLTEEYYKNTNINNIAGTLTINQPVDFDKFILAIKQFIKQNDGCRIMLSNDEEEIKQWVADYEEFSIDIVDVNSDEELSLLANEITSKPFLLYNSYLFKFVVFRFPDNRGGFIVNMHHLIADSWTMGIAVNEIIEIYSAYIKDKNFTPKDTALYSYTNYIESEQEYKLSDKYKKDKAYWNEFFSTIPDNATIPSSKTTTNVTSSTNALREQLSIPCDLLNRIKEYCNIQKISLFNFLMAIFSIYISRVSNLDDFCIGTPILNRSNFKEKNTTGMFINTLPLRVSINNALSFKDFVNSIMTNSMALLRHQKYAFQNILEDLRQKNTNLPSLYQIMISYQITKMNKEQDLIPHESIWYFNNATADDIDIHIFDLNDTNELNIAYDYNIDKYTTQDMINIHNRILNIILQILNRQDILLSEIEIVTPEEKATIMETFNKNKIEHPRNINIYDCILNIGKTYPNKIAINDEEKSITYKELLKKSDCIARNLKKHKIQKSDCVAVLFPKKSIDLICSMLGILRVGACFLAIYPDYPKDRISYMLNDSNAKLLITDCKNDNFDIPSITIDGLENLEDTNFPKINNDDNAYLIYTSGSTGKPKGTMQTHNNLINFVYSFQYFFKDSITSSDSMLSVTNICFDVSIAEIFTPLFFGATLFLYKDLNYSNPHELSEYIIQNGITFAYFPPSMLQSIYEELSKYKQIPLNKMLVGVEPIKASTLQNYINLNPDIKIINGYGPSETTICCTMYPFDNTISPNSITPIGFPMCNSKILILDSAKQLTPVGHIGEIYVQGECVGNGYINNEVITKERFDLKNKIYKTGDLAKWLPDGNIMYVGRNDNQIKYRGYRIDLGEIENCIKRLTSVENCTVILDNTNKENPILISFIILKDTTVNEEVIRQYLTSLLPHYMIPNQFIFLDNFPLTPNGKIDRKYLLNFSSQKETQYVAPTTELEIKLANLWCEVLGKDKIGINDNFFELGGDSLNAIKIVTLANQIGIPLSAQSFYTYPTIYLLLKHCIEPEIEDSNQIKENYLTQISIQKKGILPLQGEILLVGATGFLGAHLLKNLIYKTNYTIYCLIRGKLPEARLKERLNSYFGDSLDSYFGNRIIVINGDFCKENLGMSKENYKLLLNKIKTVINSAAIVKHIGKYEYFYNINVLSVQNLINFCKECHNAHLIHISTLSVSGSNNNKEFQVFAEKDLYIGQNLEENVYIKTKFEAEQLIAKYIANGFNATIFRLGNITWRNTDGIFQVNENENLFFNLLDFIIQTQKLPTNLQNISFNISPVDECADLIIQILLKANNYNVYHIYNPNTFTLKEISNMLNSIGFSIEFIDSPQIKNIFEKQLLNYPSIAQQFNNKHKLNNTSISSPVTTKVMKQILFNWTNIDSNYFNKKLGGKNEKI